MFEYGHLLGVIIDCGLISDGWDMMFHIYFKELLRQ